VKILGIPIQRRQLLFLVGDVTLAFIAIYLGHALRLIFRDRVVNLFEILDVTTGASLVFIGTHLLMLYIADAYNPAHDFRRTRNALRLFLAVVGAFTLQMAISYATPYWSWRRSITLIGFLTYAGLVLLWRIAVSRIRPPRAMVHNLLIAGAGRSGRTIAKLISEHPEFSHVYHLKGFVDDTVQESDVLPVLGTAEDLPRLIEDSQISMIVVAIRSAMSDALTAALLGAKSRGVAITDMPTLYKSLTGRLPIESVAEAWIIFAPGFQQPDAVLKAVTRLVDIGVATIGLLFSSPVLLASAVAIKISSRGPVVYSQERLGLNERPFTIYKLRTMRQDAEAGTGAVWSEGAADPRVTWVGRLLRRTRLDEIPQLWNVLRGDMSLIGPRPEREVFVNRLKQQIPFYSLRHAVKPGLTGWAQVMFRYGGSADDAAMKLQYELYAIQEMSPVLYMLILMKTVQTVLLRPGS
jgi:exopolysaccharide biosynthesis polyprenyl glycosylphosphotransferase